MANIEGNMTVYYSEFCVCSLIAVCLKGTLR